MRMDYQLMVSPDLDLSPSEIATAWNADAQASTLAQAQLAPSQAKQFNPAVDMIVALMTSVGAPVSLGLLTNALYDVLKGAVMKKHGEHVRKHLKITQFDQ